MGFGLPDKSMEPKRGNTLEFSLSKILFDKLKSIFKTFIKVLKMR